MLSRREEAEKQSLRGEPPKDEPGEAQSPAEDLEKARSEVRKMEQELRRAMRRLDALECREGRSTRREQRQNPDATPARPPVTAASSGAASSSRWAPPARAACSARGSGRASRACSQPGCSPFPRRRQRGAPRPGPAGGVRGPGGLSGDSIPGPGGPGGPVANPRVERRLRELESKLDRLLKELEGLKGEKKDKANEKDDEEDDDQASLSPRFFGLARDTKFPMFGD